MGKSMYSGLNCVMNPPFLILLVLPGALAEASHKDAKLSSDISMMDISSFLMALAMA